MTIRWSAVSAISLIGWLDTNAVRSSAARVSNSSRTQWMPSGSRPLTRLFEDKDRRVAEQGEGDVETPGWPFAG
jgi:hypothetical protein